MKIFSLNGDVAFVTGAGSGIGQSIAIGLAKAGADVALFDLPQQASGLEETRVSIENLNRKAIICAGSVTDSSALTQAVGRCELELGALSVAVNAAGIANAFPAESMALSEWQKMLDVDLTGVFLSCQAQANSMLPRGRGSIVNIASMSGSIVNRGLAQAHYNTAKAGVIHLSKSLAMEWVDRGIRVNSVSPGYTLSPMNRRPEVADQLKAFAHDTPMQRIATVDEMVGPVVFLVSRAASFVTGHDLLVDGGFTSW
jgi:NAD(P)-dependent dehydrogenase (short-subunit alcohol dehydrogenase family)